MLTLLNVRDGRPEGIDLLTLRGQCSLMRETQQPLGQLGLLDAPAYGAFRPVSRWAGGESCRLGGTNDITRLTADRGRALLAHNANAICPLVANCSALASTRT